MKNKILILTIIACILAVLGTAAGIYIDQETKEKIEVIQNIVLDEIDRTKEIKNSIEDNASTINIEAGTEDEEQELEKQETENEAFELQGEIVYEGERARNWDVELGNYAGLTYYSQVDSRWASHIYTSTNNNSQTIGTSGCGPTSAAMIVSSIKGTITPDIMGDLFVQNGYRSANSGTYWSAFRAVADEFDIEYKETSSLDTAIELLKNNNYIIASVGNGLFTYGGHFIVLVSVDNNTIKIYDPYLYNGKFDTSTRRNKVTVDGNSVYCSVDNFKAYSNYKGFFAFGYDSNNIIKENPTDEKVVTNTSTKQEPTRNTVGQVYTLSSNMKLYTSSNMSTGYNYKKGTKVQVIENVTNNIDKVRIIKTGLVRYMYIDNTNNTTNTKNVATTNSTNLTYTLSSNMKLYVDASLRSGYNYKKGTKVQVLEQNNNVAKIRVTKTGLIRYVDIKLLK